MSRYTVCTECGQLGHMAERCEARRQRRPWQRRVAEQYRPGPSAVTSPRRQRPRLEREISLENRTAQLLREVTGQEVSTEWAARVVRHVLEGRSPAEPWPYIRGAILRSEDPVAEFLPIGRPGYF